MIVSFGDKDTQKIWEGFRVKTLSTEIQEIGRRKLRMLNNSVDLNDLVIPPSNRLEKLKGDLKIIILSELIINGELFLNGIMAMLLKYLLLIIIKYFLCNS